MAQNYYGVNKAIRFSRITRYGSVKLIFSAWKCDKLIKTQGFAKFKKFGCRSCSKQIQGFKINVALGPPYSILL